MTSAAVATSARRSATGAATSGARDAEGEPLGFDENQFVGTALDVESAVTSVVEFFDQRRREAERIDQDEVTDEEAEDNAAAAAAATATNAASAGRHGVTANSHRGYNSQTETGVVLI